MSEINVTIPGRAVGKQRPRVVNGHAFTPERTRAYEEAVADACDAAREERIIPYLSGPITVSMRIFIAGRAVPDLDNIVKAILDGGNTILYANDRQVKRIYAEMFTCAVGDERVELVAAEIP